MDILLLNLAFLFKEEIYITDTAALVVINKFVIRHGYRMTEQQSKSDKYNISRKYWFQCDCGFKIKVRDLYSDMEKQCMHLACSKNCLFKIIYT